MDIIAKNLEERLEYGCFAMLLWRDEYDRCLEELNLHGYEFFDDYFDHLACDYGLGEAHVFVRNMVYQMELIFEWEL